MISEVQAEKFAMEQVFLKDLSFETATQHRGKPLDIERIGITHRVGIELISGDPYKESRYEVTLSCLIELMQDGSTRYLAEVEHGVQVVMACPDAEVRNEILYKHVPVHINPYSLQTANMLLAQAGVPPLRLNPYQPLAENIDK